MSEDIYRAPESDLTAGEGPGQAVAALYNEQNGLAGILGGAATALATAILWKSVDGVYPLASPLFLALSGVIVGLAVRLAGRGLSSPITLSAVACHWLCIGRAFGLFRVRIVTPTPLVILVGLVLAGSFAAYRLSHRTLTRDQKSVVWQCLHQEGAPIPRPRNAWWAVLTTGILCAVVVTTLAAIYASQRL